MGVDVTMRRALVVMAVAALAACGGGAPAGYSDAECRELSDRVDVAMAADPLADDTFAEIEQGYADGKVLLAEMEASGCYDS